MIEHETNLIVLSTLELQLDKKYNIIYTLITRQPSFMGVRAEGDGSAVQAGLFYLI